MTTVKAAALKQPFSALFKKIVQNNTQVKFYRRTISKSIGDRYDNNVVWSLLSCHLRCCKPFFFMLPNLKKLEEHISFGLSARSLEISS